MRKLFAALLFSLCCTTAYASDVSRFPGPNDASQLNAIINTLIVSGNQQWSAGGVSWLGAGNISANGTTTISFSVGLGAAGISPSTNVEWIRIRNPSGIYRFFPVWGCGNASVISAIPGCQ